MIRQGKLLKILAISGGLLGPLVMATPAQFEVNAIFKRNPKIWGTYKLHSEKVTIKRGKKSWSKRPPKRIGDMVISDGHLIFIRENKTNDQTQIVVDKIPYDRGGKKSFKATGEGHEDKLSRLYENDLRDLIPHKDLLKSDISYKDINCRKKKASLVCTLKGDLTP